MKKILFLLFLLISISARAETYYIKTGGSDAADGLTDATAWETITKVNTTWAAGTFAPGDSILFNKGNSFYGTITITESGTAGSPIYIGSYGTGADPIITGFQTLSSWTDAGGSIYYATLSSADDTTTMVTVDGVHTAMGRYPDSGTNLTFESHSTTVSITDTGIGDATDWAGADIVINKNWWILERARIKDHTGDVFTYQVYSGSSTSYVFDDRYYFIQNDLRTVTATNEWWHDYANSRLYIYGNPATKTVKAAALNYLINVGTNSDYITIDGLNLQGSIRHAINIGNELGSYGNNNNIIVKNCNIDFAGLCGISAWVSNVASAVCEFDGNTISHTGANGIFFRGNNIIVTDNNISYAGVVPGLSFKGNDNQGISAQGSASPSTITISRNNITYTGYNGIGVYYSVTGTTSYNYIAYAMQLLDDGGGIYYGSYSPYERIIDHNIILYTGRDNTANAYIARGLYLDSGADAATVTNNTIAHTLACGIALHSGDNNVIRNNLSYDNGYDFTFEVGQIVLYEDTDYPSCTLNTITNNQFIAKLAKQRAFIEDSFDAAEAILLGTTDSNYYARPIDNDMVMYYQADSATLATWQTFSSQDAHSSQGTVTVADTSEFYFKYNNSLIAVTYDLTEPKIDIEGNKYTYEFTLQPFESIVLFTDPAGIYTPTGLGWDPVYKKMNFKDEVNFVQGIKINGVPVIVSNELSKLSGLTATAGELNVLDGVDQTLDATEINTIKGATGNLQGQINALDAIDASKADTSLSNLASVAINTHLLPDTAGTINLGSGAKPFAKIFGGSTIVSDLSIGDSTSNTIAKFDSVAVFNGKLYAFIAGDTVGWGVLTADSEDITDHVIMLTDTTHTNGKHILYTQWQVDSIFAGFTSGFDSVYIYAKVDSLINVVGEQQSQIDLLWAAIDSLGLGDFNPPSFLSAEVGTFNDSILVVILNDSDVQQDSIPAVGAFTVKENGSAMGIEEIDIGNDTVYISLDALALEGYTYTVSYNKDFDYPQLQDSSENITPSWTNRTVTNNVFDAFPSIVSVTETLTNSTDRTSHPITMPGTVDEGDLLLVFFAADATNDTDPVSIDTDNSDDGWTDYNPSIAASTVVSKIFWKIADSDGDTLTVLTNEAQISSSQTYRITNFESTDPIDIVGHTSGGSQYPDPPAATGAYGADDYLWIVFYGADSYTSYATAAPTDFTGLEITYIDTGESGGSCSLNSAYRKYNVNGAYDPGTFTSNVANEAWQAYTIIINPIQ